MLDRAFLFYTLPLLLLAASCGGGGSSGQASPFAAAVAVPSIAPVSAVNAPGDATSSDAFVDSAGINVHLVSGVGLYGNPGTVQSLISALNVRHIRDGAAIGQPGVCAAEKQFAAQGIHLDLITAVNLGLPALASWTACLGSAIESIESPNEYDTSGDPNWVASLAIYVQGLRAVAPSGIPIIAPSLTTEADFIALGNLGASVDEGNMHNYMAGRNPGTTGWGATDAFGTYATLAFDTNLASTVSGGKPVISTETGYSDDPSDPYAVPPATQAHYLVRTLLNDWNAGVGRTYIYELQDEGGSPFSHYGIIDGTGNPKPAYLLLKSFLSHLADPGGAFATTPLNYTLSAASTVQHTLLQRRNGTYSLVLWIESPEWDPVTSSPVALAGQTATLTFAKTPSSVTATSFSDAGTPTTQPLGANGTVSVTGSPAIVDIVP
jgi:hypothetical protein